MSRDVQDAIQHEGSAFEESGRSAVLRKRGFPMLPNPGDFEPVDVLRRDAGERGVTLVAGIASVVQPIAIRGEKRGRRCQQQGGEKGPKRHWTSPSGQDYSAGRIFGKLAQPGRWRQRV